VTAGASDAHDRGGPAGDPGTEDRGASDRGPRTADRDRGCRSPDASAAHHRAAPDRHLRALELPVVEAARALVGCTISYAGCGGVIVETEAYHDSEPACHAFVGLTPRTRPLFEAPGIAYVYRSYGIHALLNVVVEPPGVGAAVLIRALEPTHGLDAMFRRRARPKVTDLCSGPGKLTQACGIGLALNETSLLDGPIRLGPPPADRPEVEIVTGLRIGITHAAELPWRFCAAGNRNVSRPWPPGLLG
jgi:DNA-3-methyladenine glycosylase